jgi:hypothetical protein
VSIAGKKHGSSGTFFIAVINKDSKKQYSPLLNGMKIDEENDVKKDFSF